MKNFIRFQIICFTVVMSVIGMYNFLKTDPSLMNDLVVSLAFFWKEFYVHFFSLQFGLSSILFLLPMILAIFFLINKKQHSYILFMLLVLFFPYYMVYVSKNDLTLLLHYIVQFLIFFMLGDYFYKKSRLLREIK